MKKDDGANFGQILLSKLLTAPTTINQRKTNDVVTTYTRQLLSARKNLPENQLQPLLYDIAKLHSNYRHQIYTIISLIRFAIVYDYTFEEIQQIADAILNIEVS